METLTWEDIVYIKENPSCSQAVFFKNGSSLTIGGFDGPHKGHETLCLSVIAKKKEDKNLKTGVITFATPPKSKNGMDFPGEVSTLALRLAWFKQIGFDFVVVIDFSHKFSTMSGTDFLSIVHTACCVKYLFVGQDFKCGYKGAVGIEELQVFANSTGFSLSVIDTVNIGGMKVSSSAIRTLIKEGRMEYAAQLLGRPYTLDGTAMEWNYTRKENEHTFVIDVKTVTQVLPPKGRYRVSVLLSDMTVGTTVCYREAEFLRLSVSHPASILSVRAIDFI